MKILMLNSVYREGSTGKIVAALADVLRDNENQVMVCYGIGHSKVDAHSSKICTNVEHVINALLSRITGIPYGGFFYSNHRVRKIIKEFNPDIVHIHCVNASIINVYDLLNYLARTGVKTVLTLHAEIFHTGGCSHAFDCEKWREGCHDCKHYRDRVYSWFFDRSQTSYKLIQRAIESFAKSNLLITAVSPWLAERAKQSAVMRNYKVVYVPNGVNTMLFHYQGINGLINRNGYKKVVLFVTPYFGEEENDVKGGRFLPIIAALLPDYKFVVVATKLSQSLSHMPNNIQLWCKANTQYELAQLYSEADVTLLLSKRETFSMVTAESLCCGTPVIGFKAGGPESIALEQYTKFVDYGDIDKLVDVINSFVHKIINKHELSALASNTYSSEYCALMFTNLYKELNNENSSNNTECME